MAITHCWLLLLNIITIKGISGQYYSQLNPNSRYYSGNYNGIYKGNYNGNLNPNILRYPEAAVRPGELIVEVNEPPGQTPCRNKEASKDHKDSLWWTLPIPPMELDGSVPERPPQVKQPEPAQQVDQSRSQQMNSGGETGAIQQKHGQIAPTSTAKAQVAPAAPVTPQAVAQVATTAKHEAASSAPSKQDRTKVAQMQKQQQQMAPAQQAQTQNAAPVPSQLVVSNKDNANQQQMITNKSVATMRAPGRPMAPINQHGGNKQKAMLNMNMIEPAGYQYPQEVMPMPQGGYMNNPYFNAPFLKEPQLVANRGYRGDMMNSMAELADNMYKNFDTNDAELGGGGVVGDNSPYGINQAHPNVIQYDTNFAPLEQQDADQWALLSEDERNKRNPLDDKVAIS